VSMYDLEDVGEANLKGSRTTGEKLIKGKRIDRLITEDCAAGLPLVPAEKPKPWWMTALRWALDNLMRIVIPVAIAMILAALGLSLG